MTVAFKSRAWDDAILVKMARQRGLLVAIVAFLAMLALLEIASPAPLSYFDFSYITASATPLALAAMGLTIVVLTRALDLSHASVISLVNVIVATQIGSSVASQVFWCFAAIGLGAIIGAVNGLFVAYFRLTSIVVTLATMFIVQGMTLLVLTRPGGAIPPGLSMALTGDVIDNLIPAPLVVLLVALAVWGIVKQTSIGRGFYAVGSDEEAARASGVPVTWVKFWAFVLAGAFYGAAGLFVAAQTGTGDPLAGRPLLLPIFAAVVLGGTMLSGGRGGCLGTIFGALILGLTLNILLALNISPFYSTLVEGVILILAAVAAGFHKRSALVEYARMAARKVRGWARYGLASDSYSRSGVYTLPAARPRPNEELQGPVWMQWFTRNREILRYILPSYAILLLVVAASIVLYGDRVLSLHYINSVLLLAAFFAVLGLGQGVVILSGGLDLSVPWTISLSAILLTGLIAGAGPYAAWWAIPLVLLAGASVGAFNGMGVVLLGLPPIIVTLASNGIVQGLALLYIDAERASLIAPAPPVVIWFMEARVLGLAPVVWALALFVLAATLMLSRTSFGRHIYAVGNSQLAARLSGVRVGFTLTGAYVLSGICSAIVGIMLVGLSGTAFRGMGDPYLLPAIAVVVVGGVLITGGRGHYLGIFGGALLLTAVGTLFAGTTWSQAVRDIIYGLIVLSAIALLRKKED